MSGAVTTAAALTLRALEPRDSAAVRALALPEIARSPYAGGASAALEAAIAGTTREARGIIALNQTALVGVVVLGEIAGAEGAGRLQLIVVDEGARSRGIATRLVEQAAARLGADGMRFVAVELPDEPELAAAKRLLLRCGFHVEATVADYFRDGVDLAILQRALPTG
jgi:ribosomal protein S18 acetylase RimI-like enzyme